MNQQLDEMIKKTQELIAAPTCCPEAKSAAQHWLDALGTAEEESAANHYFTELEEDIMPIDQLLHFADSEAGKEYFGAEKAAEVAAHAKEIKDAGSKYCDCPACAAAEKILAFKEAK